MKTIVYQSFRSKDVPLWMNTCLESVYKWAKARGFDYRFYDDIFFNYACPEFRVAVKGQRHLVSDLARLELANELLENYDRVIWVDADVYVNNPSSFLSVIPNSDFLFCKEFWLYSDRSSISLAEKVNNAVMVMDKGNSFLNFYRYSCHQIVKSEKVLRHNTLGTLFLTEIHRILAQPLLGNVGIFSPELLLAIFDKNRKVLNFYEKSPAFPIHAANLCLAFFNRSFNGRILSEDFYESAIDYLDRIS